MIKYVAKGVRTENRKITIVWLAVERGFGSQWSIKFENSYPYNTKEQALSEAKLCNGPHFNMPDPETIEVVEVDYTPPQNAKLVML